MSTIYWTQSSGGSQSWATGGNWSGAAAPASGDSVTLQNATSIIDSGLAQSAVALASLAIPLTFAGAVGSAAADLQISAAAWRFGDPSASGAAATGSGRIRIDFGSNVFTGVVLATGNALDSGLEPLRIKGSNAANKLYCLGGRTGVATSTPTDIATLAELDATGATTVVNLGAGVSWTTILASGGSTVTIRGGGTTLTNSGATVIVLGSGSIATVNAAGLTNLNCRPGSGAAISTLNVLAGGIADFSGDPRPLTVTTTNLYKGATLKVAYPGQVTFTNPIQLNQCGVSDVSLLLGNNFSLAIAAL